MKVKDLIGINPEAEIVVVFVDGTPYTGKMDFGWSALDGDAQTDTKLNALEVCIFLGDIKENAGES